MRYYKYWFYDTEIGEADTYIEVDDDGWTIRQIRFNGTDYIASNASHPTGGLFLADTQDDYDELVEAGEVTPITQQEFDKIWQAHLAIRQPEWDKVKHNHPIGMDVQGFIRIFYPQGVIVDLGDGALGVADHKACRESTKPELLQSRQKITATVSNYDEINQWVILDSRQVHAEKV